MAEKDLILSEKVEHTGLIDFKGMYSYAHNWLKNNQYGVDEIEYKEKIDGNKKNISIKWEATKIVSDYFKIKHEIRFNIQNMTDVEIEIDGKKKQINKGFLEMPIKGILITDAQGKWEISPLYRFWRDIYNKYIIPSRIDRMKDKVFDELRDFKESIKAFLDHTGNLPLSR